jgi:predicted nuclease with TOPRIM domain
MKENTKPHYSAIIDRSSIEELKLALLRSIDHARKSTAELAEMSATLEGAIGQITRLETENGQLRDQLSKLSNAKKSRNHR